MMANIVHQLEVGGCFPTRESCLIVRAIGRDEAKLRERARGDEAPVARNPVGVYGACRGVAAASRAPHEALWRVGFRT